LTADHGWFNPCTTQTINPTSQNFLPAPNHKQFCDPASATCPSSSTTALSWDCRLWTR
jgi:hypothetical protein